MSHIRGGEGEGMGGGIVPLVDIVLDLLLRSLPASSLSSPRLEPLECFSAFVGLDIGMKTE